jgi:hypothetical protein
MRIAELGGGSTCAVGVAVGDGHPAVVGGERVRHRPADARGAADD